MWGPSCCGELPSPFQMYSRELWQRVQGAGHTSHGSVLLASPLHWGAPCQGTSPQGLSQGPLPSGGSWRALQTKYSTPSAPALHLTLPTCPRNPAGGFHLWLPLTRKHLPNLCRSTWCSSLHCSEYYPRKSKASPIQPWKVFAPW